MQVKVAKFGGSSLASAQQFKKIKNIIAEDSSRRYIVASAPGKRDDADTKVTDLLYGCFEAAESQQDYSQPLEQVEARFASIIEELEIQFPLKEEIQIIRTHLSQKPSRDYLASRGEYLNSKILAEYLGFTFVDAADGIVFCEDGRLDSEATNQKLFRALKTAEQAVIPGFYGAKPDGTIQTFTRGGSDVTGALAARAVQAQLYENWTDVSGLLMADPRIVKNPKSIETITYKELREISYMGAAVLHEDVVFPVRKAGIPINIKNTNQPEHPGTMIVPDEQKPAAQSRITSIAGKKGFSSILIEKAMMNAEVGFGQKVLKVLEKYGVPFEHLPSGIDTMSVIVSTELLEPFRLRIRQEIQEQVQPDSLLIEDDLALVAVVGRGMFRAKGVAAAILTAVAKADINIRMLDQGSSEINIILGVDQGDYEAAVEAIYREFA